jgi:SAM-dependent methyltransferase
VNGAWDFAIHIATPEVRFHLGNPHEKVALEIGCGGGRLLAAASQYFRRVIGLDIHTRLDWVRQHLAGRGIQNCDVIRGDGATIPVPDHSVDFVYSFIVLHHLQSFEAFVSEGSPSFTMARMIAVSMKRPAMRQMRSAYRCHEMTRLGPHDLPGLKFSQRASPGASVRRD